MGLKQLKPITPGSRFASRSDFAELTTDTPEKGLTVALRKSGGRNNHGRITARRRGGGHRRRYRIIDFKRNKFGIAGKVATIEYDPNRSAFISLIHYNDGEKRYIVTPVGLKVGDTIQSGEDSPLKVGNTLPLKNIPTGLFVHNVELEPGRGGQMVRSAGASAQIAGTDENYCIVKLGSGEVRKVISTARATIGSVSNSDHQNIKIGKAGRNRWKGKRPSVRGVAMNPVDHPHGGGEGKTSGGRDPVSPWGQSAKGLKTRKNKRTNKFIISRRKK